MITDIKKILVTEEQLTKKLQNWQKKLKKIIMGKTLLQYPF